MSSRCSKCSGQQQIFNTVHCNSALQAATILVAMASGKNNWRPKFRRKSPIGDQQIKRETFLKNYHQGAASPAFLF